MIFMYLGMHGLGFRTFLGFKCELVLFGLGELSTLDTQVPGYCRSLDLLYSYDCLLEGSWDLVIT